MKNRDLTAVIVFILCCAGLLFVPTGFKTNTDRGSRHARAKVLSIDNSDLQQFSIVLTGSQRMEVEVLSGEHEGEKFQAINQLQGRMEFDEIYEKGDTILIEYRYKADSTTAYSRGHYRIHLEILLAVMFAVFLVSVAGWTGTKALLSFVFAALMIWKLLIPAMLKGWNPYPISVFTVAALTASVSFLVGGINKRGLATFAGSFSGLVFASVLAVVFTNLFSVDGAVRPFAESLLYAGFPELDLNAIFTCGIFIACSGAVMDLAMDISSAMHEIKHKRPDIHFTEHILSGLRVGRNVIGTMTTTLLLAYSGGYTTMLMYYMGQGTPLIEFFNLKLVSAEILNVLVGSFGLVAVAPFTALVAGLLFKTDKHEAENGKPV
ncbi:YibE/F family protein [Sedimentisphaera salicampi]|uniref:YibE/F-like protein n=1 Tax=Sedimentisphaera salicampi TaxID=1941349 RepID=A0A1W6LMM7_9BACT|nr:YibE/F family protein [Sedimentisphaera salicampi]ARN57027.1 YibE/F-like protein [Sedimentisphaera salicampi]